jgi:hypothetical protein
LKENLYITLKFPNIIISVVRQCIFLHFLHDDSIPLLDFPNSNKQPLRKQTSAARVASRPFLFRASQRTLLFLAQGISQTESKLVFMFLATPFGQ